MLEKRERRKKLRGRANYLPHIESSILNFQQERRRKRKSSKSREREREREIGSVLKVSNFQTFSKIILCIEHISILCVTY